MKFISLALAFIGLRLASATRRWEITPLTDDAMMFIDDQNFDTGNYNHTLFNVTGLPELPSIKTLNVTLDDDCDSTGNLQAHPDWCVPTKDTSQCNAAYYFPRQLYDGPAPPKNTIDNWIYDNNCQRIIGCHLNKEKDTNWWSTYSSLRWTLESRLIQPHEKPAGGNYAPDFKYVGVKCQWPNCQGWTSVYWKDEQGPYGILLYRHSFRCDQP